MGAERAWRVARRASGGWPWISASMANNGCMRSIALRAIGLPLASNSSWK
jgi:hypothetical protein